MLLAILIAYTSYTEGKYLESDLYTNFDHNIIKYNRPEAQPKAGKRQRIDNIII